VIFVRRFSQFALFNDNGFATEIHLVNPELWCSGTNSSNFADSGPSDHGAFSRFTFGALAG
jgi:hypothetical protein